MSACKVVGSDVAFFAMCGIGLVLGACSSGLVYNRVPAWLLPLVLLCSINLVVQRVVRRRSRLTAGLLCAAAVLPHCESAVVSHVLVYHQWERILQIPIVVTLLAIACAEPEYFAYLEPWIVILGVVAIAAPVLLRTRLHVASNHLTIERRPLYSRSWITYEDVDLQEASIQWCAADNTIVLSGKTGRMQHVISLRLDELSNDRELVTVLGAFAATSTRRSGVPSEENADRGNVGSQGEGQTM